MKNELKNYLSDVEKNAKEREENLINSMAEKEKIDENLKAKNQMEWVRNDE